MNAAVGRRRPQILLAVLSCLTLTAGLSGCAARQRARNVEPAAGHSWNQTHRVELAPGWRVSARNVGTTDESTSLDGPGSKGCLVSSWSSKPERYSRPQSPKRVSVQGRDAAYGELDPEFGPYPRAVVWQAADDLWFGVSCDLDQSAILALAEGVHAGKNPMRVPFKLTSIPEGLTMVQLIESTPGDAHTTAAQFEMSGSSRPLTMQISNERAHSLPGPAERQSVGGREVEVRRTSQSICLVTRFDPICIFGPGDEPATDWSPDARRVVQQTAELLVPVEDPDQRSEWLDADEAFPR